MSDKMDPIGKLLDEHFLRPTERVIKTKPTITIVIRWGLEDDDEEDTHQTETFRFFTKEEADAFMTGVEAANGWMEYTVLEDGRYPKVDR